MSPLKEENSLIKLNPALLVSLSTGQLNLNVFGKNILVLECMVAGTSFCDLEDIEPELLIDLVVDMRRDGNNKFDVFAVALYFGSIKIGYIAKNKNEVIARLMDAGKAFIASITSKEWEGNWLKLEVKVFLKD